MGHTRMMQSTDNDLSENISLSTFWHAPIDLYIVKYCTFDSDQPSNFIKNNTLGTSNFTQ